MTFQVISHVRILIVQKLGFSQGKVSRQVLGDVENFKDLWFQRGKIDCTKDFFNLRLGQRHTLCWGFELNCLHSLVHLMQESRLNFDHYPLVLIFPDTSLASIYCNHPSKHLVLALFNLSPLVTFLLILPRPFWELQHLFNPMSSTQPHDRCFN
jgi:hypothetical protein